MPSPYNVVIVGGSRGLGLAVVEEWLKQRPDSHVYATARKPADASQLQELIAKYPDRLTPLSLETTDASSREHFAASLPETVESVWLVAGISEGFNAIDKVAGKNLLHLFEVNAVANHETLRLIAPHLIASPVKQKTVLFYTSFLGSTALYDQSQERLGRFFGFERLRHAAYSVSKSAVDMLSVYWADFLAEYDVSVLAVSPGAVVTDMNRSRIPKASLDHLDEYTFVTTPEISAAKLVNIAQLAKPGDGKKGIHSWDGHVLPF